MATKAVTKTTQKAILPSAKQVTKEAAQAGSAVGVSPATKRIAVVRIRGINDVRPEVRSTLDMMNLRRINNLTFLDNRPAYLGMLQKGKDLITWGEPTENTIASILAKWGRTPGDNVLTDEYVAKNSTFKSIEEFAKNFIQMKAEIKDIKDLKSFFRLHPPKHGYRGKGSKFAFHANGALGYRGEEIDELIIRMSGL